MNTLRLTFLAISLLGSVSGPCQNISVQTNDIRLDVVDGVLPTGGILPTIRWIYPRLDHTSSTENKLNIEAEIDHAGPIKEVRIILADGKGDLLSSKQIVGGLEKQPFKVHQSVILQDGSNQISIQVTMSTDAVVSASRTVLIGKDAEDNMLATDRKDYALFFATDKYDSWDDLVNPVDDSYAIARILAENYGFETEVVENPSAEQIWEKLRTYSERKFKTQDQLLIFFAGHGHYDESFGEGFVVAKNSLRNDLSRTTYLSHNRLRGVINNIPNKHILLAMDVCFGGTIDPYVARGRGADNEISLNEMLSRKLRYRTRKYLTSGGKEYVSDGIAGKHSPFAARFIEALKTRGGEDGVLTLIELQAGLEKLKQLPRFGPFGDDEPLSDFVFVGKKD